MSHLQYALCVSKIWVFDMLSRGFAHLVALGIV